MLLRYYTVLLLIFAFASVTEANETVSVTASTLPPLTEERKRCLLDTYDQAIRAVKNAQPKELESILFEHAADIKEALDRDIVPESLLYLTAIDTHELYAELCSLFERQVRETFNLSLRQLDAKCRRTDEENAPFLAEFAEFNQMFGKRQQDAMEMYKILAKHGIELGASQAFKRSFYNWVLPGVGNIRISLARAQELFELSLVRLEDLWIEAINLNNHELFNWLREQGADMDYRIPLGDSGEFESVLGRCAMSHQYDLMFKIIEAGANVDISPKNGYTNLWHLLLAERGYFPYERYPEIAAITKDLFAPLYDERFVGSHESRRRYPNQLENWLTAELKKRLEEGRIDLQSFDRVDERGWTLLDRATFFEPRRYISIIKMLSQAGLPTNFPLTHCFYTQGEGALRDMIESGQYDCNEQPFPDQNLLSLVIDSSWFQRRTVVATVKHGASVIYPEGFKYRNAIEHCYLAESNVCSDEVLEPMANQLSAEQLSQVCSQLSQLQREGKLTRGTKLLESILEAKQRNW